MGRGWDQNDWEVEEFLPNKANCISDFPNSTVLLER